MGARHQEIGEGGDWHVCQGGILNILTLAVGTPWFWGGCNAREPVGEWEVVAVDARHHKVVSLPGWVLWNSKGDCATVHLLCLQYCVVLSAPRGYLSAQGQMDGCVRVDQV